MRVLSTTDGWRANGERTDPFVLHFDEIAESQLTVVGGKGAHLAALARMEDIRVPAGFCVTTHVFERIVAETPAIAAGLEQLIRLRPDDGESLRAITAEMRRALAEVELPAGLAAAVRGALARIGEHDAYAVRSSATAEDSPTASFAGQHDSFLGVVGPAAILEHVRRCWASLFTERAVTYRMRNGIDHRTVRMAVVVQRMVVAEASGVLFTADPVTGNRKVASMEATYGLGEALVSGRVNPDVYEVRDGEIVTRAIAVKLHAVDVAAAGGTRARAIEPERQERPALSDAQVRRLAQLGRRIEGHLGCPQDVEWCLADGELWIVQSRPITTLFPIPATVDGENHVFLSVGHQQMMTDAMAPLGLSIWQLTTPRPMRESGGRLFVDVTQALAAPSSRAALLGMVGRSDPVMRDALQEIVDRGDFITLRPDAAPAQMPAAAAPAPIETDPAIVTELMARSEASVATLKQEIRAKSGAELLEFIQADLQELKRILFDPRSHQLIMEAMDATWWLNERLEAWLGERNMADALARSVSHNVTSEMGLALLDVADAIRPHPAVVEFLRTVEDERFVDALPGLPGGIEARDAIQRWLDRYGMRGVGEIDITRPRWSERPSMLVPLILGNVRNFEPGAAARRFEQGRAEAASKAQEVLARLRALPDGERTAAEAERMIDCVRTFMGYREYPKYGMISRYFVYKQALLREAERLVQEGVLRERDDLFYLRFEELQEVMRTHRVDESLIRERRAALRAYRALVPPRVLTSDGESVTGRYRHGAAPVGALAGLPASAGTVEGRARVVLDVAQADLEPGDILVTAYTDPSWTPLFVAIAGLVTEVGSVMTHGAVIAREYGLPAVVAVDHATRRILDGQRIRVHGTDGYVEILS